MPAASLRTLALAGACLPAALAAQQPRRAPAGLDIPALRRAVVTILALDDNGRTLASGTGFFVTEGYVLTAAHVLAGATACNVELSDQQRLRCSVSASDTAKDVAMLRVPGTPPATLRWGSSEGVKDGDEVTVISNPLGELPGTVSKGIVSASRVVRGTKLLQISAPISHGSSGGPVLNARGQVIGIVRSTNEAGQSLNFATATDAIRHMNTDPTAVAEATRLLTPRGAARGAAGEGGGASATGITGGVGAADGRAITVGQTMQGSLSTDDVLLRHDSTYAEAWAIKGLAGQTVTIDLESDDFDAYLFLRGPGIPSGREVQDDDSGGSCNARLTATFPQAGEYEIVVNTSGRKYATGNFTLSVTSGSKPKSVARCSPS